MMTPAPMIMSQVLIFEILKKIYMQHISTQFWTLTTLWWWRNVDQERQEPLSAVATRWLSTFIATSTSENQDSKPSGRKLPRLQSVVEITLVPLALSADQTEASATETAFGKMANVLILWVLKFLNKRFIASVCRIILFILSRHIAHFLGAISWIHSLTF